LQRSLHRIMGAIESLEGEVEYACEAFWDMDMERSEAGRLCRDRMEDLLVLEQENTALREQLLALQVSVRALTAKAAEAPPPKWLLRAARQWSRYGADDAEAMRMARKVMRWTHTYMIKAKSLKGIEDVGVQEDAEVRADDGGVDGAS
jgi:hypothetical protein